MKKIIGFIVVFILFISLIIYFFDLQDFDLVAYLNNFNNLLPFPKLPEIDLSGSVWNDLAQIGTLILNILKYPFEILKYIGYFISVLAGGVNILWWF